MALKLYLLNILIVIDQLLNVLLNGSPDETLSSRAHRMRVKHQPYWWLLAGAIDVLFFWQRDPGHCERAYLAELWREQLLW